MMPWLLVTLALAASPQAPVGAPVVQGLSAHEAVEALANNPLDPTLQLELARRLGAQPDRVEESVEILAELLKNKAVAEDARRLLIDTLLAAPAKRAWASIYRAAASGAATEDAARLSTLIRTAEHLGAGPSLSQPLTPPGSDPRGAWAAAPNDVTLARHAAEASIAAGDRVGALAPLEVVLDAWPADRAALGMHTSASTAAGQPARAQKRLRSALLLASDIRSRTALMDDLVAVTVLVGEQHKLEGAPDDALRDYLTAAALRPSSLEVMRGAAGLEWQLQHLEGAWLLYNRVLKLQPHDVDALMGAVTVGLKLGHDEGTHRLIDAAAANRASSKDPRILTLQLVQGRAERAASARAAARIGDPEAAAAEFQRLILKGPPEAMFFHGLADALCALGRKEEAAVAWQQAVKLDPTDAWATIGAANALIDVGRTEDARGLLLSAPPGEPPPGVDIERLRTLARAWRMDGDTARTAGKPEQAVTAYAAALDAYPEVWACEALASLYLPPNSRRSRSPSTKRRCA
jgi:tetratricopeptide (TPR) repeat protein